MSSAGWMLVVMMVTRSGEGISGLTLPTVYGSEEACETEAKKMTFNATGGGMGFRGESKGVCVKTGGILMMTPAAQNPPTIATQLGVKP